ncbi:MAG: adenylate cyclase [Candidatus Omnitrophota bacterium]|jgi:adenylate cyclase
MFADIADSTGLYKRHGDELAREAINECISTMSRSVIKMNGKVIDQIGDELMCTFPDIMTLAVASQELVTAVGMLRVGEPQEFLKVRIGFYFGNVMQDAGRIYGDTVHTAKRMVDQAKAMQVITTKPIIDQITAGSEYFSRFVDHVVIKGRNEEEEVHEMLWNDEGLTISWTGHIVKAADQKACALILRYNGQETRMETMDPVLTFGRTPQCDIYLMHPGISRQHGRLEYRRGQFYLVDQSTNGSFLVRDGQIEVHIRREEAKLEGAGSIRFDANMDADLPEIAFVVEDPDA